MLEDFPGGNMRRPTKPSRAKCTLEHCTAFLLAKAQSTGGVRLAEVSGGGFAHDAATRFLGCEEFAPKDLFEEVDRAPGSTWRAGS